MRRERMVFLVGVTIIAVHVIDDSYLNPEPGTSASDHLVSGLGPLAVMVGAVAVYPRARPGIRALISLVLGLFGIVASTEGWYYATKVGPSGDDYTGLLTLFGGIALVVLAAVTAWKSRRTDGSLPRRWVRRGLIGVTMVGVLLFVVGPFLLAYPYTHISRAEVPAMDLGGAEYVDVSFRTSDGLELKGWYLPSRNGAAVIAFAGRLHAQNPARFLAEEGYGVLLYDRRGEAQSEGDPNAFGWDRATDVEAGITFLKAQPEVDADRIGGIGFSVGGEMLLEAAATNDDLRAVVSEGAGIRSFREASEVEWSHRWTTLPIWMSTTLGTMVFGNSTPPANLKDLVDDISPRPVLLIYATQGQGGEQLNSQYFAAAGDPKELWLTDSTHVHGYQADPEAYESRVIAFFDEALS